MSTTDNSSSAETSEPIATSEWNSNITSIATSEAELTPKVESAGLVTEPFLNATHPETGFTAEAEAGHISYSITTPEGEVASTPEAELTVTSFAETDSTPEGETVPTPFAEIKTTPEAEAVVATFPEVEATPESEIGATSHAEMEITPEAEIDATIFAEVETTPEAEAAKTPFSEVQATPEAEAEAGITSFPEVQASPESEIGLTPFAEVETTPEAEAGITSFPEVEVTPESEIGLTPFAEVETTPEAEAAITSFPEVEVTPESEIGSTSFAEVETTPEAEVAMSPFPEVETTPENELTPYPEFENHPNAETAITPYAEFELTPKAEIHSTPESESIIQPESEITSAPEHEFSSVGEVSPETEVEVTVSGEPESEVSMAEPTPAWAEAIPKWGAAWPIHIYFFGAIFILIAIFALYSFLKPRKRKFKVVGMLFNRLVLFFLFVFALSRALCLLIDPYHSSNVMPALLYNILWALGSPCLISSLGVYMILLLDANYAVKTLRLAKLNNFLIVCIIYFILVFVAEFMTYFTSPNSMASRIVTFICQAFYFLWGAFCNIGFIIAAVMLHQRAILTAIALAESRKFIAKNFTKSNKMSKLFTLSICCSIIGLALSAIHFYAMVTLFNMFIPRLTVQPWPWWAFQTSYRMIEVIASIILCKVATVASAVKRYSHVHREGFIASICFKLVTCCGGSNRTDSEVSAITDADNPSYTKVPLTLVNID